PLRSVSQPIAKLIRVEWGTASSDAARIKTKFLCERDQPLFQLIAGLAVAWRRRVDLGRFRRDHCLAFCKFSIFFKIASATSSCVSHEVSTRMLAILA